MIANGHSEHVRSQVPQRLPSISDRLAVDNPRLLPDGAVDLAQQAALLHHVFKLSSKDFR